MKAINMPPSHLFVVDEKMIKKHYGIKKGFNRRKEYKKMCEQS